MIIHGTESGKSRIPAVRTAPTTGPRRKREEGAIMNSPTLTIKEAENLPAMMDPYQWAKLTGQSHRYVQESCKAGVLPCVRVGGGRWRILTRKALAQLGIDEL